MDADKDIDAVLNNGEIVGTISSPSSNLELTIDIFEEAITKKLIGELVVFKIPSGWHATLLNIAGHRD